MAMWQCFEVMPEVVERKGKEIRIDANYNWEPEEQREQRKAMRKLRKVFREQKFAVSRFGRNSATGRTLLDGKLVAVLEPAHEMTESTQEGQVYKYALSVTFRS